MIKVGSGAYHYFMIQKEHVNGESFFRIFQAYDQEYTLQDWLQSDRKWDSAAKENFGRGQWLSLEKMQEFMSNIKNIISSRDAQAFQNNFGVSTNIYEDVFISVNIFLKKANCQETIALEEAQLEPVITPTPSSQTEETHSSSNVDISMLVLGGFIAAAGITTVAIAFTLFKNR